VQTVVLQKKRVSVRENIQDDEIWKTGSILRKSCMEVRREDGHVDQGFGAVEGENEQVEGR